MKKITLLLALTCLPFTTIFAQSTCGNRDFEDSTFTGWSTFTGDNTMGLLLPMTWVPGTVSNGNDAPTSDPLARHIIITQNALDSNAIDPITMLPDTQMTTLAPNGGFITVRLGGITPNYQAEKISWTYAVTSMDTNFQYQYACILNDGGHPYDQQPYMLVNFIDQSGNPIAGLCDTIYASDPNVPFITSGANPSNKYRRWTPQSKNLGAFIGQNITVEFVVSGCSQSGHFGYAYIDVSCFGTSIPNVWPGDADYDLQANNADILTLGLTYLSTGTTRASASNSWTAQPSADWPQHIALGANYKHSDCNGDGIVDLNDTTALINNYALSHVFRQAAPVLTPNVASAYPQIYLVPVNDSVGPFSYAYVDIYVGSAAVPIDNLYGLSFTVNYDHTLIQPNTVFTDFSGSYLGVKNVSMITLAHDNSATGENEIGMCRNTHTEINGYGYLGRMRLSTYGASSYSPVSFTISDVHAINGFGVTIPLNGAGCSVVIDPTLPAGIQTVQTEMHVNLFPNPANQLLTINTSELASTIVITDALGRTIFTTAPASQQTQIDVSGFAKGIYFVTISSESGITTKQLIVGE
jgi:hypothetical protein